LYQYRVDFNPEEDRIGIKRSLIAQHRERLGGYLFDGTMLFSGTKYDPDVCLSRFIFIYHDTLLLALLHIDGFNLSFLEFRINFATPF